MYNNHQHFPNQRPERRHRPVNLDRHGMLPSLFDYPRFRLPHQNMYPLNTFQSVQFQTRFPRSGFHHRPDFNQVARLPAWQFRSRSLQGPFPLLRVPIPRFRQSETSRLIFNKDESNYNAGPQHGCKSDIICQEQSHELRSKSEQDPKPRCQHEQKPEAVCLEQNQELISQSEQNPKSTLQNEQNPEAVPHNEHIQKPSAYNNDNFSESSLKKKVQIEIQHKKCQEIKPSIAEISKDSQSQTVASREYEESIACEIATEVIKENFNQTVETLSQMNISAKDKGNSDKPKNQSESGLIPNTYTPSDDTNRKLIDRNHTEILVDDSCSVVETRDIQFVSRKSLSDRFGDIERAYQKKGIGEAASMEQVGEETMEAGESPLPLVNLSERFTHMQNMEEPTEDSEGLLESMKQKPELANDENKNVREKDEEKKATLTPSKPGPSNEQDNTDEKDQVHVTSRVSTSPTSFLNYSDDDDDDDDDLLHTAPVFLKSIQEITNRPSPEPTIGSTNLNSSIESACDSPAPQQRPQVLKTSSSEYCLDNLLLEQTEKADHVKDYNELKTELGTEGGFVNKLNVEEEACLEEIELQEDQEQILKQLNEPDNEFPEDRPGVQVFNLDNYGCMFDGTLQPCHCGFTVGDPGTTIEHHVQSITHDQYSLLVESDILSMCFAKITCQSQLLRWLFFIMSVDDNFLLRHDCKKTLLNVIHQQRVNENTIWSPTVTDFITVLCNYGASLVSLIPKDLENEFNREILQGKLLTRPRNRNDKLNSVSAVNEKIIKDKIKMVLEVLPVSLMKNYGSLTTGDLKLYLVVIFKMSLDPVFKNLFALSSLHTCIDMLIQNFSDTDWENEKISLCRVLQNISRHHHDMVYMSKLLPEGTRGVFVQRRLCYLMLNSLLMDADVTDTEIQDFKVKDLYQFVPVMTSLLHEDLYKMSSVISLMDKCVASNHSLTSTDREDLGKLIYLIKKLRVKDNVALMNRTKVKDMLVRVTNSWSIDIQTFKGKQTKMFEYVSYDSPIKMKIEKIELHDSDASDDSLSEAEDSDDIEEEIPSKIRKISDI